MCVRVCVRVCVCLGVHARPSAALLIQLVVPAQACGREAECIQLFKSVERSHPTKRVRKEAANLRFILEAPRLTVSEEERVKIPVMGSAER